MRNYFYTCFFIFNLYSVEVFQFLDSYDYDCVLAKFRQGIDINITDPFGHNALHILINDAQAIDSEELRVAEALLRMGINVNAKNHEGRTPLMYAVERSDIPMIRFLLRYHADPRMQDVHGNRAIDFAVATFRDAAAYEFPGSS